MFGRKFRKTGAAQPPVPVVEDSPQNALASVSRPRLITKGVQEPVTPYVARSALPAPAGSPNNPQQGGIGINAPALDARAASAVKNLARGNADIASRAIPRPGGMKKGGKVGGASKRADGIAQKGKTKGRMI